MARTTRRRKCKWLVTYWYFGDVNDAQEFAEHRNRMQRDRNHGSYLRGIPREFRNKFHRRNRYHDKRELKRVVSLPNIDDNFSQWKKNAAYWWY